MALTLNWFVQATLSSLFILRILHARRFLLRDELLPFSASRDEFFPNVIRGADTQITSQRPIFGNKSCFLRRAENGSLRWSSTTPNAIGSDSVWSGLIRHAHITQQDFFDFSAKSQLRQKIQGLSQYKTNQCTHRSGCSFLILLCFQWKRCLKGCFFSTA